MDKYVIYKLLHILGIALTVSGLAGLAVHGINGGTRENNPSRKLMAMAHGIGMLLLLVAGFGLAAAKYNSPNAFALPWVHPKLLVYLLLGAAPALLNRKPQSGRWMFWAVPLLVVVAGYFAIAQPGG